MEVHLVLNLKQLKIPLGTVLQFMRTVFFGLLFVGLLASFATSAHTHVLSTDDAQKERVAVPPAKFGGLGGQFVARHGSHTQKSKSTADKPGSYADMSKPHGLTHIHDVPILGSAFAVSDVKAAKKLGNARPQPSQVFDLQTDIFHPPKV